MSSPINNGELGLLLIPLQHPGGHHGELDQSYIVSGGNICDDKSQNICLDKQVAQVLYLLRDPQPQLR